MKWGLGIGDWGLGIGDWAQSPIPNPQFNISKVLLKYIILYFILFLIQNYYINNLCQT